MAAKRKRGTADLPTSPVRNRRAFPARPPFWTFPDDHLAELEVFITPADAKNVVTRTVPVRVFARELRNHPDHYDVVLLLDEDYLTSLGYVPSLRNMGISFRQYEDGADVLVTQPLVYSDVSLQELRAAVRDRLTLDKFFLVRK